MVSGVFHTDGISWVQWMLDVAEGGVNPKPVHPAKPGRCSSITTCPSESSMVDIPPQTLGTERRSRTKSPRFWARGGSPQRWNTVLFGESWWIQIYNLTSQQLRITKRSQCWRSTTAARNQKKTGRFWRLAFLAPNAQRILSWFCKNDLHSNDKHGKMIIFQTWFCVFHVKKQGGVVHQQFHSGLHSEVKSTTPMSSLRRWCLGSLEGPWRKRRWCGRSVSPMYLGSAGREPSWGFFYGRWSCSQWICRDMVSVLCRYARRSKGTAFWVQNLPGSCKGVKPTGPWWLSYGNDGPQN